MEWRRALSIMLHDARVTVRLDSFVYENSEHFSSDKNTVLHSDYFVLYETEISGEMDCELTRMEARILGPNLLDMRFYLKTKIGTDEIHKHVEHITYSGSFSVEWDNMGGPKPEIEI